jgi:hypothetical protein
MQRTKYLGLTPMCIGGSKGSIESMLEFINFFQAEKNKEILLDILPKKIDHQMPEGSSQIPLTRFWDDVLNED